MTEDPLEIKVANIKARIADFKIRYSYLYPPTQPSKPPIQAKTPPKKSSEMSDLRKRLLGVT